jgi:hypothetical protein
VEADAEVGRGVKKVAMPPLGGSVDWKSRTLIPAHRTFHLKSPDNMSHGRQHERERESDQALEGVRAITDGGVKELKGERAHGVNRGQQLCSVELL